MLFFSFLVSFILLKRLRKALAILPEHNRWDTPLNVLSWVTVAAFFTTTTLFKDRFGELAAVLYLLAIVAFIYRQPAFKTSKPLLQATYPYTFISLSCVLLQFIAPTLYKEWEDYIQMGVLGGFIWFIAVLVNFNKQQKALEAERKKRLIEDEQNKVVAARKEELEILVAERTAELTKQKDELQETVKELQATQAQLVQQEKLASLGELTAGIAHEIQNPLNFVNNFSELSTELLDELKAGPLQKLPADEIEYATEIITDLTQNLQKINHHGRRADSIVKGMLHHSRANTGQKELTDLNALADEYLRLSYHGLRAKDKTFNAQIQTCFAPDLAKIEVVPQDIGRVFLNLFNNAFYSVHKKKQLSGEDFKPQVTITSQKNAGEVEFRVKDNGVGIPENIRHKILQPFFTTKPTGQGTGLGLSLSHDIITKGHGGTLAIESAEGEYAEFIIRIPVINQKEVLI